MMLAALILASIVPLEPPCPPPTTSNLFVWHVASDGSCSYLDLQPCAAGVPIVFNVGAFGYSFACSNHTFAWDFGDGATSREMSTVHTFTPGTYNVTVRITSGYGSLTLVDRVVVAGVFEDLGPYFTYSTNVNVVHFQIQPYGSGVTRWYLDFGDGVYTTLNDANPPEIVHTYARPGTFVVTLYAGSFDRPRYTRQITITFPSRSRGARH